MRISQMLAAGSPTISFEFFPPRDDAGFDNLFQTIDALRPLQPSYVSVTYGAGGSTRRKTIELVRRIKHEIGIESMAHLTCVGASRAEIDEVLDRLEEGGIENVLPLRGDPPQGQDRFEPVAGGFRYASELVAFIRQRQRFCLGGACYPETHPEASSPDSDLANLKRKVDSGAEFLITQLFFDNQDFLRFRDRASAIGIGVPILAGIMPVRSLAQTQRFASMCGARIPSDLLKRLEAVRDSPSDVRRVGIDHATHQCRELLAEGVSGLHFYTLNRSTATIAIYRSIRGQLPAGSPAA